MGVKTMYVLSEFIPYEGFAISEFLTKGGEVVQLDRTVPGDGTKWYVANLYIRGWAFEDDTIEPEDLLMEI